MSRAEFVMKPFEIDGESSWCEARDVAKAFFESGQRAKPSK